MRRWPRRTTPCTRRSTQATSRYSSGLERVEARKDASGALEEYVCHFKPREKGGQGIVHREIIRWYEPNRSYASSGEKGNPFGVTNDLSLVTAEPSKAGTILTWDSYYDAPDLAVLKSELQQAHADIADNLISRFGGKVIERYVEQSPWVRRQIQSPSSGRQA